MRRVIFLIIIAALLTSACESEGQKAIRDAEARAVDRQSQAELAKKQAEEDRKRVEFERAEEEKAERYEATKGAVAFAKQVFFLIVGVALACSLAAILAIVVIRFWGLSRSLNKKAAIWAVSLPLDAATGSYPLLVMGGAIHNPNNALGLKIGDARDPDRQLATGHEYTRALTVATEGARQIAKATEDVQSADVIYTAAGTIPLIGDGPFARERETLANSGLPQVMKDILDKRIAKNEVKEGTVIDG